MRCFLAENFQATFAGQFLTRLLPPHEVRRHKSNLLGAESSTWIVSGLLPLKAHGENGSIRSRITITVKNDWLEVPPYVIAHEDFIRRERDWHAYEDGGLCYVLKDEWRDRLDRLLKNTSGDISYVMDFAETWLLAATDSLTTRHLIGSRHKFEKWPADWEAYEHGEAGVKQYQRQKGSK